MKEKTEHTGPCHGNPPTELRRRWGIKLDMPPLGMPPVEPPPRLLLPLAALAAVLLLVPPVPGVPKLTESRRGGGAAVEMPDMEDRRVDVMDPDRAVVVVKVYSD